MSIFSLQHIAEKPKALLISFLSMESFAHVLLVVSGLRNFCKFITVTVSSAVYADSTSTIFLSLRLCLPPSTELPLPSLTGMAVLLSTYTTAFTHQSSLSLISLCFLHFSPTLNFVSHWCSRVWFDSYD